jgi:hypothetical protein
MHPPVISFRYVKPTVRQRTVTATAPPRFGNSMRNYTILVVCAKLLKTFLLVFNGSRTKQKSRMKTKYCQHPRKLLADEDIVCLCQRPWRISGRKYRVYRLTFAVGDRHYWCSKTTAVLTTAFSLEPAVCFRIKEETVVKEQLPGDCRSIDLHICQYHGRLKRRRTSLTSD